MPKNETDYHYDDDGQRFLTFLILAGGGALIGLQVLGILSQSREYETVSNLVISMGQGAETLFYVLPCLCFPAGGVLGGVGVWMAWDKFVRS